MTNQKTPPESLPEMGLVDHLVELRRRLIRIIIIVVAGSVLAYVLREHILAIIITPIKQYYPNITDILVFITPSEAFLTFLKISVYSGIIITAPLLINEVWQFVKPALYKREKILTGRFLAVSTLLFYLGILVAYYLILPFGFRFLLGFSGPYLKPMLSIRESAVFIFRILVVFGLVFELPIILFVMSLLGIVTSARLKKARRYIIVVVFLVAAFLTPPDPLTQIMLALPLILLYEISIQVIALKEKTRRRLS